MACSSQYVSSLALSGDRQAGYSRVKHFHLGDIWICATLNQDISIHAILIC